jgi:hypothetical protein
MTIIPKNTEWFKDLLTRERLRGWMGWLKAHGYIGDGGGGGGWEFDLGYSPYGGYHGGYGGYPGGYS